MWDPCTVTTPTARKQHTCSGCGSPIPPGTEYTRTEGMLHGEWSTYKDCGDCVPADEFGWVRPSDYLETDIPLGRDTVIGESEAEWSGDGVLTVYSWYRYGELSYRNRRVYEAAIVPGVGLLGFWEVK